MRTLKNLERKLKREKKTLNIMIGMYCKNHHHNPRKNLCENCTDLLEYALIRLEKCPQLHNNKPICAKCTIHCYKPDKREYIREVMRYSGPRMLLNHPYLAILHVSDMLRKEKNGENRFQSKYSSERNQTN